MRLASSTDCSNPSLSGPRGLSHKRIAHQHRRGDTDSIVSRSPSSVIATALESCMSRFQSAMIQLSQRPLTRARTIVPETEDRVSSSEVKPVQDWLLLRFDADLRLPAWSWCARSSTA
jgi:hypothetical protein